MKKRKIKEDKGMSKSEKDVDRTRQLIVEALKDSIIGRVEKLVTDELSAKVSHLQEAERQTKAGRDEAHTVMLGFEERAARADAQIKERQVKLAGLDSEIDEKTREVAKLETYLDKLNGEISAAETRLKGSFAKAGEEKLATLRD